MQAPVIRQDAADSFAFTASAYGGAIRLRASGRRTLVADHHEHQLHIHLVAVDEHEGRRGELRANKSGSAPEFLAMAPDRRARAVARVVERARFPPGCADGARGAREEVRRRDGDRGLDADAAASGNGTAKEETATEDADTGVVQFARGLCKHALGYFGLIE